MVTEISAYEALVFAVSGDAEVVWVEELEHDDANV